MGIPSWESISRSRYHFVFDEYIENMHNLAAICQHKFRYVGLAYRGLAAMVLLHILTLTLG